MQYGVHKFHILQNWVQFLTFWVQIEGIYFIKYISHIQAGLFGAMNIVPPAQILIEPG